MKYRVTMRNNADSSRLVIRDIEGAPSMSAKHNGGKITIVIVDDGDAVALESAMDAAPCVVGYDRV